MQETNKIYTVNTPDSATINFEYIKRSEAKEILSVKSYKLLPEEQLDFFKRKAYLLSDGKIFYEIEIDENYYLFDDISNYLRMIRGKKYYDATIIVDKKDKEAYCSFNLYSESAKEYFNNHIERLLKYPVFDGYHAYLMQDSSVTFLRERIYAGKSYGIYDGYWYPAIKDFEYYYYSLTSDKYAPDPQI